MPAPAWSERSLRAVVSSFSHGLSGRWCRSQALEGRHRCSGPIAPHRRRTMATSRNLPREEDLPTILTAAGMVKLCGLLGNRASPLIGLDVAPSNFGVAISDETRTLAFPLTRVPRRDSTKKLDPSIVLGKLREIIEDSSACGLVVGWPLAKSGRAEGQCLMVLQFLRQLHLKGNVDIPVTLCDERLTSMEARAILKKGRMGRKIAEQEDQTAAMVILQAFLDSAEAEDGRLSTLPTEPPPPGCANR